MFTKLNTKALSVCVSAQTAMLNAANSAKIVGAAVLPGSRAGKLEFAIGAAIGYLLYLVTVPAFADEKDQQKLIGIIKGFTTFVVVVAAAASVFMFVTAGIQWIFSGGSERLATSAKNTVRNVVLGILIIAGAFILRGVLLSVVGGASNSGDGTKSITKKLGDVKSLD